MAAALYVVLEKEISGVNASMNGKSLSRSSDVLTTIAEEIGVLPLMNFFSAAPDELFDFAESEGIDTDEMGTRIADENWFSAEEGLSTVRALSQEVQNRNINDSKSILADLREMEAILEQAMKSNIRWHLAVDF